MYVLFEPAEFPRQSQAQNPTNTAVRHIGSPRFFHLAANVNKIDDRKHKKLFYATRLREIFYAIFRQFPLRIAAASSIFISE